MKGQNTEKNFIIVFWKLYENKKIEKISIRELCQLAGYNRTTFYAHFNDIYDLLSKAIDDFTALPVTTLENLSSIGHFITEDVFPKMLLTLFKSNDHNIELLIKNHHLYMLEEKAKTTLIPILKKQFVENTIDARLDYIMEYQISAVFGVIKYWFQAGKSFSEIELFDLLYRISSKGVLTILGEKMPAAVFTPDDKVLILETIEQMKIT